MEPLRPDENAWYAKTCELLGDAYLTADNPRGQSGFRGDEGRWERAWRPITAAIDRNGTFLDIGCANGLLMETLTAWSKADGHLIEPVSDILRGWGYEVSGQTEGAGTNGATLVRVAWIDAPR